MDWVLSALVLLGNFLLGRKIILGWYILAVNSILWVYYAWTLSPVQWGLMPSAIINFFLCLHGIYKWMQKDDGWVRCDNCNGKGYVVVRDFTDYYTKCEYCGGGGKRYIPTHQEMG